jgi:CheY-like chemotaxis protein
MPQMGGRELAENLVQKSADIKVLFLSGYTDSAVLRQGLLDPGSFFLQKPFTPAQLAYKVRQALDS